VYVDGEEVEDPPAPSLHIPDSPGHLRELLDVFQDPQAGRLPAPQRLLREATRQAWSLAPT
jgi:hypothetical protein